VDITAILVIFLVFMAVATYFILMIFYPEWVGISGKSAKKSLDEHKEGSHAEESDFLSGGPKRKK
jgi:hypothetical protein